MDEWKWVPVYGTFGGDVPPDMAKLLAEMWEKYQRRIIDKLTKDLFSHGSAVAAMSADEGGLGLENIEDFWEMEE